MTTVVLWLLGIVFFITVAVIFVLGYVRYKELKLAESNANSAHQDVRDKQQQYRQALQELANKGLIDSQQKQGIVKLINNFFIFQPVNDVNFSHFDQLYATLMVAINAINAPEVEDKEHVAQAFHELARNLPIDNSEYSARFYLDMAPVLAEQLAQRIKTLHDESVQKRLNDSTSHDYDELDMHENDVQNLTQTNENAG